MYYSFTATAVDVLAGVHLDRDEIIPRDGIIKSVVNFLFL